MINKGVRLAWIISAILVGLYPLIYYIMDGKFGLLNSKSDELLANPFWRAGFYTHITLGGVALLTGWTQFGEKFRNRNLMLHRRIGKVYVITVLCSATAGIYIAFFATGGVIAATGFAGLGIAWFTSTLAAYLSIRKHQLALHKQMMIYSYAACFSAVTLRIYLPLLIMAFDGKFIPAYRIVAWLAWVPNLIVAYLIVERSKKQLLISNVKP